MYPNQKVTALKREGRLRDAWLYGKAELDKNPQDEYLRSALAWLCYEKLKRIQSKIDQRHEWQRSPTDKERETSNKLLELIMELGPTPPEQGFYGPLAGQLRNYGHHYYNFVRLVLSHGKSFFAEEDYVPYQGERYESPSQLIRVARLVARAWLNFGDHWGLEIEPVLELLQFAEDHAEDRNKVWLENDYAKCLIASGRLEEARQHMLRVLARKKTEGWAWSALADTYISEDKDAAVACYCKALSFDQEESFTIPARKGLAGLLVQRQEFEVASMLTKSLVRIYEANEWQLKADVEELLAGHWYDASVNEELLEEFIKCKSASAEKVLHGEVTKRFAIVDRIHRSGKGFNAFVSADEKYAVRRAIMPDKQLPALGEWVVLTLARVGEGQLEAVEASRAEEQRSENVQTSLGVLQIHSRGFGFVNDVFVPKHYLLPEWDGREVVVTGVWDTKPDTAEKSWRGIKIELVDERPR